MKRMMIGVLGLALLAGCHSNGTDVDAVDKLKIERNVTTEAELRKELGKPQTTGEGADGSKILMWSGSSFHGFGGWGHHESAMLRVTIKNGVVTDYQRTEHGKD